MLVAMSSALYCPARLFLRDKGATFGANRLPFLLENRPMRNVIIRLLAGAVILGCVYAVFAIGQWESWKDSSCPNTNPELREPQYTHFCDCDDASHGYPMHD